MSLAADLVLVTTDPATGRSLLGSTETDPVLGGALLVDLVLAERVDVEGAPRKARVRVVTTTPVGSPPHDRALARLRPGREPRAANVVPRLGKGARTLLREQLVAERAVAARRERLWGVLPVTRYDVLDTARRQRVLAAVTAVLAGEEPDETSGPLVALLQAGDVVKRLVPKPERRAAVRRAKEIAKGEWAGSAARAAVVAASAAASAAVTASVAATASSSGSS